MWSEWIHHQKSSKIWVLPSSKHSYWNWWFSQMIYWLVVWNMFYFSIYWECHHPNWRTHIFQRGRYTTNQSTMSSVIVVPLTYSKGSVTSGRFCFRRRDWVMLHWSNHQQVKFTIHCGIFITSANLTVCYWKLPFIVYLPFKNGDIPSFFVCLPEGNLNKPVEPVRNQVVAAAITWGFSWWFNVIICYVLHQKWWKIYDLSRFHVGNSPIISIWIAEKFEKPLDLFVFPWTFNQPNWWDEKTTAFQQKRGEAMSIFGDIGWWIQEYCYERGECVRITYIYI